MTPARSAVKRTARAILLDLDDTELIVIKRTKPGLPPYWITPGGGVEPSDETVVSALHREVSEELGAKICDVVPAFVDTVPHVPEPDEDAPPRLKVQHFFVCRLATMDPTLRHGPEVEEPRGTYEIVRLPFTPEGLASVDLVPASLSAYLARNILGVRALLAGDFA
ncbi:NUDIX hydrolase [Streptomyces sp. 8K308]|uniref:NUDIX hydrolase n=1 Tax=Streptomyces sp. 8K308 TaxID=2530388 RepID=UPI00104B8D3A|nr:NUDIX hydrolase [Streptomyces sp. 8K308]TDC04354.1 NUDIX hydrolase [Streptomyces sp. 8K308]